MRSLFCLCAFACPWLFALLICRAAVPTDLGNTTTITWSMPVVNGPCQTKRNTANRLLRISYARIPPVASTPHDPLSATPRNSVPAHPAFRRMIERNCSRSVRANERMRSIYRRIVNPEVYRKPRSVNVKVGELFPHRLLHHRLTSDVQRTTLVQFDRLSMPPFRRTPSY